MEEYGSCFNTAKYKPKKDLSLYKPTIALLNFPAQINEHYALTIKSIFVADHRASSRHLEVSVGGGRPPGVVNKRR